MVNGIEITDVIIFPVKKINDTNILAFCRIAVNDVFVISGIKIMQGRAVEYVLFPSELNQTTGKRYDYFFPVTAKLRAYITERILAKYRKTVNS